jgi:hypothetical protein
MPEHTKPVSSATLTVYPQFTFLYSFKIDVDFPSCFGVNDGVEHAGMQCSYCVSMSGLHKGQDRTSIPVIAAKVF